jgi:CRISPR/Cas system Type II protein with McrA/HNH and RuvC-like nuclease domain
MKTCTKCKEEKPFSEFYFFKKANDYYSWCKVCQKKRAVQSRRQVCHSDDFKDLLTRRFYNLLSSIHQHTKDKPMQNNVTMNFLREQYQKQDGKCFYTGVKMKIKKIGEPAYGPFDLSVDRINSSDGYIQPNVVFCCWGINAMKSTNTPIVMYEALKTFYETSKKEKKI